MGAADWTVAANSLGTGDVLKGSSAGITPPPGGGSFAYGFNSISTNPGAVALFTNQLNFNPMASGGRISGALKRVPGGGSTGWSSFLFMGLQADDVDAVCYMVGLSDASPSKIILRKGVLSEGFPAETVDPLNNGVLALSAGSIPDDTWIHLRMDVVLNTNGDVVLSVFQNNLNSNDVEDPVFNPVTGMDAITPGSGAAFIDDVLGVNTGSVPLVGGRAGFGFEVADSNRISFFDHIEIARQV